MMYFIKDNVNRTEIVFHPDGAPEGEVAICLFPQDDSDERGLCCCVPIAMLLDAAKWCNGLPFAVSSRVTVDSTGYSSEVDNITPYLSEGAKRELENE